MNKVPKLDRAKARLTLAHPFFASILLRRPMKPRTDIPTAAVDQRGQIYYNPQFVESLSVEHVVFLLAHEVGHVIAQHAGRRGSRDAKKWNIAGDAWINDMLRAAGVGTFIDGGVDMPGSKDRTTEAIYNDLPDHPRGKRGSGDDPGGDGDGPGGIGEDLIEEGPPITKEEAERIDGDIRVEIAQAAQAAKMMGKMPAALAEIVAELIDTRVPWFDVLERFMVSHTRGDYTWSRPNRRFIGAGHYLPSIGKTPTLGTVVIQVDVSGSISPAEIAHYNGHLKRILELCEPETVHLLYVDSRVVKHEVFERGDEFSITHHSGGGTDMPAGIQYLEEHSIDPDVFVCLTDGYTPWGTAPDFPVVWCISTDIVAPYGETIPFELG